MKFLSIDFETANDSLMSACAIGSVYFEKTKPKSTNHSLIKPPIFHRKLKKKILIFIILTTKHIQKVKILKKYGANSLLKFQKLIMKIQFLFVLMQYLM